MNLQKVFCIYNKNLSFIFDKYLSLHEYCMFVCDDDVYDFRFINLVLDRLTNNDLDLAYSKHHVFDEFGVISYIKNRAFYSTNSSLENSNIP